MRAPLRSPPMDRSQPSPQLRRSPRFQTFAEGLSPSSALANEPHRRRLIFHDSAEPVTIPSSVDIRAQEFAATQNSKELTPLSPSLPRPSSDMTTQSPPAIENQPSLNPLTSNPVPASLDKPPRTPPSLPFSHCNSERNSPGVALALQNDTAPVDDEDVLGDSDRVRIKFANELTCANSFLETVSVKKLRSVLKHWEWRQSGNKKCLTAKAILHITISRMSGKTMLEVMATHDETKRYDAWLQRRLEQDEVYPFFIGKAPNELDLLNLVGGTEAEEYKRRKLSLERARSALPQITLDQERQLDNRSVPNQNNSSGGGDAAIPSSTGDANHFSINEFARLLIILRQDEDARAACFAMGQELSRAQLDAGVTRGDFWAIVECRFNDTTVRYHLNMTGRVDGVDSRLPPQTHRSATFLKDKFNDAKAAFTEYVSRWSASGQNDPERFSHFLPTLANGELNALGKRMMVMFTCTRKGTPYEEAHFSNICCKLIPDGGGCDEGGRTGSSSNGRGDSRRQSRDSRKKTKDQDTHCMKEMASSISKIANTYVAKRAVPGPISTSTKQEEEALQSYTRRLKKIKLLGQTEKLLGEIEEGKAGSTMAVALRDLRDDVGRDLMSNDSVGNLSGRVTPLSESLVG